MAPTQNHLLIIDPQNDFCDLPTAAHTPALPVPGAHADMLRLAALMDAASARIDAITITLDSHHHLDIAHPTFWQTGSGEAVAPFTQISAEAVRTAQYLPRKIDARARAVAYLEALEAAGRYRHMVWPVHCEIGTWGHNVHDAIRQAYNRWEAQHLGCVNKVVKGTNPWTEHYSAVMAEVPDAADPSTALNQALIDNLSSAQRVYIAGEAASHCVKATTEHIAAQFGPANLSKLVLIRDCMSPVTGFEAHYTAFLADMAARGAQVATAAEVLAQLNAAH